MSRIELTDSAPEIMMKMADGNPGAINVLLQLFQSTPKVDPDCGMMGFGPILNLDSLGVYGSRIWMLYKDVCGQNVVKTLACIRAYQLGILRDKDLQAAIDGKFHIDAEDVLLEVQKRLPAFGLAS